MVENLGKKMNKAVVYKIDIGFNITKSNVNTFIGREAHLLFLQNELLIKILVSKYNNLFS